MKLNDDTYYGKEANQAFFSVSQYKDFCKCEAMALAKMRGEYEQPTTKAMLIGILCDHWFEGTLEQLQQESPNIFYCRNGALRADFRKADEIIKRVQRDERFMQYMSGEKQKILTFEMFGAPWKMKMDSFIEGICITDLKVVQNFKSLAFWRYDLQGAVFGGAFDLPGNVSAACHDINQDIAKHYGIFDREAFNKSREDIVSELCGQQIEGEKHNALYDAEVIKAIYVEICGA